MTAIIWSNMTDVLSTNDALAVAGVPLSLQTPILATINNKFDTRLLPLGEADPQLYLMRVYYLAHLLMTGAFGAFGGAAGPVTQEAAGTMSRQYAVSGSANSDALLDTTSYGRIYHSLIRGLGGPFAVGGLPGGICF